MILLQQNMICCLVYNLYNQNSVAILSSIPASLIDGIPVRSNRINVNNVTR